MAMVMRGQYGQETRQVWGWRGGQREAQRWGLESDLFPRHQLSIQLASNGTCSLVSWLIPRFSLEHPGLTELTVPEEQQINVSERKMERETI